MSRSPGSLTCTAAPWPCCRGDRSGARCAHVQEQGQPALPGPADSHGEPGAGLPWESAPAMAPERRDCFSGGAAKIRFTEGRADLGWDLPVTKHVLARAAPA